MNYEFIPKPIFALAEEVIKLLDELWENVSDQLRLDARWQLLVEFKFLDYDVEVESEGFFDIFHYLIAEMLW